MAKKPNSELDDGIVMAGTTMMACFDGVIVKGRIDNPIKGYAGNTVAVEIHQHIGDDKFVKTTDVSGINYLRKLVKCCCLMIARADEIDKPDSQN